MKKLMASVAALALVAGLSTANAQNAPAASNKADKMEQSTTPKVKASTHKAKVHQSMRMRHAPRETTGFGGRQGRIGGGVNDPSIHQSRGDRDSRDFPKQH
jgi:Ni/Co efflux regulator RcnB